LKATFRRPARVREAAVGLADADQVGGAKVAPRALPFFRRFYFYFCSEICRRFDILRFNFD